MRRNAGRWAGWRAGFRSRAGRAARCSSPKARCPNWPLRESRLSPKDQPPMSRGVVQGSPEIVPPANRHLDDDLSHRSPVEPFPYHVPGGDFPCHFAPHEKHCCALAVRSRLPHFGHGGPLAFLVKTYSVTTAGGLASRNDRVSKGSATSKTVSPGTPSHRRHAAATAFSVCR